MLLFGFGNGGLYAGERNIAVVGCIKRFIGVGCFIGIKTAKGVCGDVEVVTSRLC